MLRGAGSLPRDFGLHHQGFAPSYRTTYNIDHQDMVADYEGQKVQIWGTLDGNGKLIHAYSLRRQCRLVTHPGDFCADWICN